MVHITWGLLVAGGRGEKLGLEVDAPFLNLGSRPMITYALDAYEKCPDIEGVVVVVEKERVENLWALKQLFGFSKIQQVVVGGTQRQTSVINGLKGLPEEVSLVSVHEATRPCVKPELIAETVKAAKRYGSGVAALELDEAVKEAKKGLTISRTLTEGKFYAVQMPQTFHRATLVKAYELATKKKLTFEEDSGAVELLGEEIHLVPASRFNLKVRTAEDLNVVSALVRS